MDSFTFSKKEKLCSQKIIGELFISGNSFLCYPLKVIWKISPGFSTVSPVQIAFSVPKRNFKRAHDRNYLKRRMREAYRLHKSQLYGAMNSSEAELAIMIVYIGKERLQYKELETAMVKVISRMGKEVQQRNIN